MLDLFVERPVDQGVRVIRRLPDYHGTRKAAILCVQVQRELDLACEISTNRCFGGSISASPVGPASAASGVSLPTGVRACSSILSSSRLAEATQPWVLCTPASSATSLPSTWAFHVKRRCSSFRCCAGRATQWSSRSAGALLGSCVR